MFIPLLFDHPEMLGAILRGTPVWVWLLLAALVWYGLKQTLPRRAKLGRVLAGPLLLTALSLWSLVGAFGRSPMFGAAMLAWMLLAATAFAAVGMSTPPAGTQFDPASRRFLLPGSFVPLATIVAIFLTRYVVNVDIAIQPALARDATYTLAVAAIYGLFSGQFLGRMARLWRVAAEHGMAPLQFQRDPW